MLLRSMIVELFVAFLLTSNFIILFFSVVPVPPTDILLSNWEYVNPTRSSGYVIGTLSTVDANVLETFTYSLTDNSTVFEIQGSSLMFLHANQSGSGLLATILCLTSSGFSLTKTFVINEGLDFFLVF